MSCTRSLPSRSSSFVIARRCLIISAGYLGWALSPVPTAVPRSLDHGGRRPCVRYASTIALDGVPVRGELLAEPDRRGVLEVGAPDFTIPSNALPFAANARARRVSASVIAASCDKAARRIAVGITSFVDCAMFDVIVRMHRLLLAPLAASSSLRDSRGPRCHSCCAKCGAAW